MKDETTDVNKWTRWVNTRRVRFTRARRLAVTNAAEGRWLAVGTSPRAAEGGRAAEADAGAAELVHGGRDHQGGTEHRRRGTHALRAERPAHRGRRTDPPRSHQGRFRVVRLKNSVSGFFCTLR